MAATAIAPMTPEAFLRWEEAQELRHEYSPSGVRMMAGASHPHNRICENLAYEIRTLLKGTPCRIMGTNTKLWVDETMAYYYPDAMVACPPNVVDSKQDIVDNPTVIFEVLSPGTQGRDIGEKATAYYSLPSAREYVLLSSETPHVTVYRRGTSAWEVHPVSAEDGVLRLTSLGVEIPVADLYDGVPLGRD